MSNSAQKPSAPRTYATPTSHVPGRVSVVIPSFNHARYVSGAVESVLAQDYHDVEIVVVDDGSRDDTAAVIRRFGSRVRYLYQANQGLSAARNAGIRAATGAYIGLLDADDFYEPQFASRMVSLLKAHPDAAGAYCGYQFVDERNCLLPQRETRCVPEERLYAELLEGNFLVPEAMLVRRECYERVGSFDPSLRALEDWDMWLRISRCFRVVPIGEVLTRHRVLSGSMSTDPGRMYRNRIAVLEKHLGAIRVGATVGDDVVNRAYGRAYLISTVEYLQSGNSPSAVDCLRQMAQTCPALLAELDTFYLLGCGSQPKGWMGDCGSLDTEGNAAMLLSMLESLFGRSDGEPGLARYRRLAYANAYLSLGFLSYGAARFGQAQRLLVRATLADPKSALSSRFVATMLKSLPVVRHLVRRRRAGRSG